MDFTETDNTNNKQQIKPIKKIVESLLKISKNYSLNDML